MRSAVVVVMMVLGLGCDAPHRPMLLPPDGPPPDAPCGLARASSCNPVAQSGCNATEKCTWVLGRPGTCDHLGCRPPGVARLGEPCVWGAGGFDDCVKGAVCLAGRCAAICELAVSIGCAEGLRCQASDEVFAGYVGVCQPGR
jgi:hypothetical protein